jgi:hypothetical protein
MGNPEGDGQFYGEVIFAWVEILTHGDLSAQLPHRDGRPMYAIKICSLVFK